MKDTLQQNQTFELGHFPNCKDACPEVQRLVMSEAALAEARDIAIVNQADDDQKLANLEHQQETKKCFFARIFDFFIRS